MGLAAARRLQCGDQRHPGLANGHAGIEHRVEFSARGLQLTFTQTDLAGGGGDTGLVLQGQPHSLDQAPLKQLREGSTGPDEHHGRENAQQHACKPDRRARPDRLAMILKVA